MAKTITRQTLKLFGKDGPTSDFGQFGSQAAASPVTTKVIATIQGLTAWTQGWQDAVAAGEAPYLQDMNSLLYVMCYEIAYQLQDGVPDWDSGTSYYIGSLVRRVSTSEIYASKVDDNLNQALPTAGTSDSNWQFVSGMISTNFRVGGPLAMNSQKVTGLAEATANGDALRYEDLINISGYRRPRIVFGSITTVTCELGTAGVSGSASVVLPDGFLYSTSTAAEYTMTITQAANLTSGAAQGGLGQSLTEATNTWYAIYAVRVTGTSRFVLVGSTTAPTVANKATLDAAYGALSYRFLGWIRNGDNKGATGDILNFVQTGYHTDFINATSNTAVGSPGYGTLVATTAGATTLTYSYSAGTGTTNIPATAGQAKWLAIHGSVSGKKILNAAGTILVTLYGNSGAIATATQFTNPASEGLQLANGPGSSIAYDLFFAGWDDLALGGGPNELF